ncbi:MAG TPA: Xaa-Pro peptidase family protein [Aestuariivirgaceae bacterium]|nr:Xaa-Pro peptidase family protein [Aestuariivirgaceae bacterium]
MQTAFPINTYEERQARVLKRMDAAGLDALIVNFPDNINYLTGVDSLGFLWYQALVLSPRMARPWFVTRSAEEPPTWELSSVRDARFYDIASQDPLAIVADFLKGLKLARGRIGIEPTAFTFSPAQYQHLRALLPQAKLEDATLIVAEERLIKTAAEIGFQRQAAEMADEGIKAGFAALRPGISEVEVAGIMAAALGRAGSEYAAISPMIATGRRSSMTHAMPNRVAIAKGDVVIIELAGVCNRYHCVTMRTAVVGRPSGRVQDVALLLEEAFLAACDASRPGAPAGAPNRACNEVLDRLDLSRTRVHRIGYSLGIAYPPTWLEAMILDDTDGHELAPNMSFTIEPNLSLYEEGFGIKLGDTVLCTERGCERLSGLPTGLTVID